MYWLWGQNRCQNLIFFYQIIGLIYHLAKNSAVNLSFFSICSILTDGKVKVKIQSQATWKYALFLTFLAVTPEYEVIPRWVQTWGKLVNHSGSAHSPGGFSRVTQCSKIFIYLFIFLGF